MRRSRRGASPCRLLRVVRDGTVPPSAVDEEVPALD
jgi:hypothetical protein